MLVRASRRIGVGDVRISPKARLNVLEVLGSHRLSYGPFSREFESRFAALHDKKFACVVNSGTDALRIGLAAMKEYFCWKPNSSVVVPALTFVASVNTIRQSGLIPRLVDIELDNYGIDPERFDQAYGDVAVMPVHLFGQPVKPEVISMARERNYRVIDDSCETMFQKGCADGDVSAFSTYACHVIQTGVGGLAATSDPQLATLIRSYANHGRSGIYTSIDDALGDRQVMESRFLFEREGFSARITELEAAIGCAELDEWEKNISARRAVARSLHNCLSDLPLHLPKLGGAHMMFPIRTKDRETRWQLTSFLEQNGIETRPMLPLTSQPYIKKMLGEGVEDRFPNAKIVNETGFYIGSHPQMSGDDVAYIDGVFHEFFARYSI